MKNLRSRKAAFTLVEVMVSSIIMIVVMSSLMAVFVKCIRLWQTAEIKNEINLDLEKALEHIRQDLRLSSIGTGLMAFYGTNGGEYTAMSMPLSADLDPLDGLLDRDADDNLIWNQTVVYHIRPGSPDKLMRTVFTPRDTNSTPATLYQQLVDVVNATNDDDVAAAAMGSEICESKTIFENLVQLTFRAPQALYDSYAEDLMKAPTHKFGSVIVNSGMHKVTLTVTNKNPSSTGYKIIVDGLRFSASGSYRDGELFSPMNSHPVAPYYSFTNCSTGLVASTYMGPEWVGLDAAIRSGGSTGCISFNVYNDLWNDNNFNAPSYLMASNCMVAASTNFTPQDMVVTMQKGIAWSAEDCGPVATSKKISTPTSVTNILYSSTNSFEGRLKLSGCWARFYFERDPSSYFVISNAQICTADGSVRSNITFNGSNSIVLYPGEATVTNSDWVAMWETAKENNYMLRYQTTQIGDQTLEMFLVELNGGSGMINFFDNTGTPYVPTFASANANWKSTGTEASPPYFADMDKDGDYDMFLFSANALKLYWNTGPRDTFNTWTLCTTNVTTCTCSRNKYTVADIDADGDLDVLYGHGASGGRLWKITNVGTPTSPAWSGTQLPDNIQTTIITLPGDYVAPELFDADGDGDLDMFSGSAEGGNLYFWRNTGTVNSPVFFRVTDSYLTTNIPDMACTVPRFADLNADGLKDLILGGGSSTEVKPDNGKVLWYPNIGSSTNPIWDAPTLLANGAGGIGVPTFIDIDAPAGGNGNGPATRSTGAIAFSSTNGVWSTNTIGLSAVEVGYPMVACFRSGVFDTAKEMPAYNLIKWTERANPGNDIYVRVRSSTNAEMADVTDADWYPSSAPYFSAHSADNSLNTFAVSGKRYIQYEALLMCGVGGADYAHTNDAPPFLRDVTIDWPSVHGLVDLIVDFGRGPDCGIIAATVDDQPLVMGIEAQMTIYKAGREGTNYATGIMNVRPLNTGL